MKTFVHILHTTGKILVFLLLIWAVITTLSSRFSVGGLHSFVVLTGSMEPKLPTSSVVYVYPQSAYYPDDIITFKRGNIDITHRIVGFSKSGDTTIYQTKGDANKAADPQKVFATDIVGKVIFSIPLIGKLVLFLKTVPGFLLIIVLPTLIFVGFEAKTIKAEWEKEIEKKILKKMEGIHLA